MPGEILVTSDSDDTTLMEENKEELKSLLMKVKEESEKVTLQLNIQKMKIMASGPIASWQIDEEIMETVTHFIFLGSKITADGDHSHKIRVQHAWGWCMGMTQRDVVGREVGGGSCLGTHVRIKDFKI